MGFGGEADRTASRASHPRRRAYRLGFEASFLLRSAHRATAGSHGPTCGSGDCGGARREKRRGRTGSGTAGKLSPIPKASRSTLRRRMQPFPHAKRGVSLQLFQ